MYAKSDLMDVQRVRYLTEIGRNKKKTACKKCVIGYRFDAEIIGWIEWEQNVVDNGYGLYRCSTDPISTILEKKSPGKIIEDQAHTFYF